MSWLGLDASGSRAGLAVLADDGTLLHKADAPLRPGLIETLPLLLQQAWDAHQIHHVAICTGPGSFTGLRTSLALAQGFAAAAGLKLWGISAANAYAQAFPPGGRPLWVVLRARRDRLYLLREGRAEACAEAQLPDPRHPIALAGDAAALAAAQLAARGGNVALTSVRHLNPAWIARAAMALHAAGLPPSPAQPAYIDPPEAKLPQGGLRQAPL